MTDFVQQFLRKMNRFTPEEIELIATQMTVEHFKKGEIVVREGTVCKKCYVVAQGSLRQFQVVEGTEKTSGFFLAGELAILYGSYLDGQPSPYNIQCLEDSILISGTLEQEEQIRQHLPEMGSLANYFLVDDFKKAENYISLLNGFSPEQRYLLLLEQRPELIQRIPLVHIAGYIGVTPESLSRIRKRIIAGAKA